MGWKEVPSCCEVSLPRGRPLLHDHQPLALLRQAQECEETHQQLQQQQEDVRQPPGGGTSARQIQPPAPQLPAQDLAEQDGPPTVTPCSA